MSNVPRCLGVKRGGKNERKRKFVLIIFRPEMGWLITCGPAGKALLTCGPRRLLLRTLYQHWLVGNRGSGPSATLPATTHPCDLRMLSHGENRASLSSSAGATRRPCSLSSSSPEAAYKCCGDTMGSSGTNHHRTSGSASVQCHCLLGCGKVSCHPQKISSPAEHNTHNH